MQKITPFLWFDDNAEEAMNFYISVFKNGKIVYESRNDDGKLFTGKFELFGLEYSVINGGPYFKFTEAISLFVNCKDQAEVDELWEKLSEGGSKSQCGWLKDKFGLSWQIVPEVLGDLLGDEDHEKSKRVMDALMKMSKIDIKALEDARDGK